MKVFIIALVFLFSFDVSAMEEEGKLIVKRCQYVSGIAMNVQRIRQETHHDFRRFCIEVDKIYQEGEGLEVVKGIALKVYESVIPEATPDEVFSSLYNHCVKVEMDKANEVYF